MNWLISTNNNVTWHQCLINGYWSRCNVSCACCWFWRWKRAYISFEPRRIMSLIFKNAPDTMFNHDELEIHRTSLKMKKTWKIGRVSMKHSRVVIRPRSELTDATLWLASLRSRAALSEGSNELWLWRVTTLAGFIRLIWVQVRLLLGIVSLCWEYYTAGSQTSN